MTDDRKQKTEDRKKGARCKSKGTRQRKRPDIGCQLIEVGSVSHRAESTALIVNASSKINREHSRQEIDIACGSGLARLSLSKANCD